MKGGARHEFAPLDPSRSDGADGTGKMQIEGIVFDMDGTLCEPQNYMFAEMRSAVGIPAKSDILDYIHALPEAEQHEAFVKIKNIETTAMTAQVPQPGLGRLLEFLDQKGIKKGICTRNFDGPVSHLLKNHVPTHVRPFSPIITRDFRPPKPSPAGILHIANVWGIPAPPQDAENARDEQLLPLIMVGDSVDDMAAGYDAGAFTVFLRSPGKEELEWDERTDHAIDRLDELIEVLQNGLKSTKAR